MNPLGFLFTSYQPRFTAEEDGKPETPVGTDPRKSQQNLLFSAEGPGNGQSSKMKTFS